MSELAKEVEANEDGALTYQVFVNPTDNTVVVFER
jgi:quinol monooxygenase YgiN